MGCVYKRKDSQKWWIKYVRAGKPYHESSRSVRKKDAIELLRQREGDISRGIAITPKVGRVTFEEAAEDLLNDYRMNGKKSLDVVERRVRKHLAPVFGGWKMANITTSDIRTFIIQRQTTPSVLVRKAHTIKDADGTRERPEERRPASNAEINRELAALKRMFNLCKQAGKLHATPHVPMLRENNVRKGFFEHEQLEAVLRFLPEDVRPVVQFAAITGWRLRAEVLPLEWRQVDFAGGEVRLDAGTTKNGEPRTFPMSPDLRTLLEERRASHEEARRAGHIQPRVFVRAGREGGPPSLIRGFRKAWATACKRAGCPGRVPHDLRRSAVRDFVRSGSSQNEAMRLSGHLSATVFRRYDIVSPDDLRAAVARLDAFKAARLPRTARG